MKIDRGQFSGLTSWARRKSIEDGRGGDRHRLVRRHAVVAGFGAYEECDTGSSSSKSDVFGIPVIDRGQFLDLINADGHAAAEEESWAGNTLRSSGLTLARPPLQPQTKLPFVAFLP